MGAKRGQCAVCGYSIRLRRDGTLQAHGDMSSEAADPFIHCKGSGKPPRPFDPNECGECMEHRFSTPGLLEACFSVAIETRKTGEALMWDYLASYHESGHKEAA
jgi:hypothetical protein